MNNKHNITNAFVKNRAEELGMDLWGDFIVPLYFDKLAINEVRKPLVIEGGRGCGKTTLLRYLSYETQLSIKREIDKTSLPKQIGVYYRADTQYLRTFRGDVLRESEWTKAFEHELCLTIAQSILSALILLTKGEKREHAFPKILELDFSVWRDFDPNAPINLIELEKYIRTQKNIFSMWLNNPESRAHPNFLPLVHVILSLVKSVTNQLDYLREMVFFIFIDEYENLLEYQMKAINTRLKHSEAPLVFHIAAKRNGMGTRATTGNEQLQERDDFRLVDIEELSEKDFDLFAAELFCLRLRKNELSIDSNPVSNNLLYKTERIEERLANSYRIQTINAVKNILPGLSNKEAADYVFTDQVLFAKLRQNIEEALSKSGTHLNVSQFLLKNAAAESICCIALLNQGKSPTEILEELEITASGGVSKFRTAEWVHHYFSGCVYFIFMALPRPCILYSGFEVFLKLSRGNARHFLELCHISMQNAELNDRELLPINREQQAKASRIASALFIKETQGSGDYGNRLFQIVNTLGQIFRLSQARASQSEAEITHFSLGQDEMSVDSSTILSECIKWSIFFVSPETKVKNQRLEANDYLFNPIFAPYFGISFNKGRKLDITHSAFQILTTRGRDELDQLLKTYAKKWHLSQQDQLTLFLNN